MSDHFGVSTVVRATQVYHVVGISAAKITRLSPLVATGQRDNKLYVLGTLCPKPDCGHGTLKVSVAKISAHGLHVGSPNDADTLVSREACV